MRRIGLDDTDSTNIYIYIYRRRYVGQECSYLLRYYIVLVNFPFRYACLVVRLRRTDSFSASIDRSVHTVFGSSIQDLTFKCRYGLSFHHLELVSYYE